MEQQDRIGRTALPLRDLAGWWPCCSPSGCWQPPEPWPLPIGSSRALYVDPSGSLAIDDVLSRSFQPVTRISTSGYTDAALWFRITARAAPGDGMLVLRIWPTYLDSLTLYEPGEDGWIVRQSGDQLPFSAREASVSLSFMIAPGEGTTYYLRLKTTSSSLISIDALPQQEMLADDLRAGIVLFLYLGAAAWMLTWAMIEFVATRERLMLWFVASQVVPIAYGVAITGYLNPLMPDLVMDHLTSLLVCGSALALILFHFGLLREFDIHPVLRPLPAVMILASLTAILMLASGATQAALQFNAWLVILVPPAFAVAAFAARRDVPPGRLALRLVYSSQVLLLLGTVGPLLGLTSPTGFNRFGILIHGASSGVVGFILLQARARGLRRAATELGITRRDLETLRRRHEITDRLLAILTHELRTPLSVARLSLSALPEGDTARRRIVSALDAMGSLIDRGASAERLEEGNLSVDRRPERLAELVGEALAAAPEGQRVRPPSLPDLRLETDRQLFGMVLRNLLDNALKYSPPGSQVEFDWRLESRRERAGICLVVSNEPGKAGRPDPARLFAKYYRAPGAGRVAGSGLGLYIARGVMGLLGGEIRLREETERVSFELWHPC